MLKLGDKEVYSIVENSFKIDGGAMFGVVPKVIWERLMVPDERNMVTLDLNLLLVKSAGKNILIDTGMGNTLNEKQKKIYGVEKDSNLEKGLSQIGLTTGDIDFVILSHLHFDHAGGIVGLDSKGERVPRFPKAKYVIQSEEWKYALQPDERTRATYMIENFKLLDESGQIQLVNGEKEIAPGIKVKLTGGHTKGQQIIFLQGDGETIVYPSDIIPTVSHLRVPYVAGVDIYPLEVMEVKRKLIADCLQNNWMVAFDHEIDPKLCRLEKKNEKIEVKKISI
ncbi:MAG TPA: MBL fold metallo-hydrolase [Terriglobales bacterium]|nr:MBL fold metallo-hydrolase [Terriglobales bacterium]